MTYNQIISRIKAIAEAHKQVRTFRSNQESNFLDDKTIKYAAVFINDIPGGNISLSGHQATFAFRFWFLDLTHVSENTDENEQDVISDMISVAMDIFAQMNYGAYNDWKIVLTGPAQIVVQHNEDVCAGIYQDLTISVMYPQYVCNLPSSFNLGSIGIELNYDRLVYDTVYIANGTEGTILTTSGAGSMIPEINGKKILLVIRATYTIFPVSNLPGSTEYTWNDSEIGLGLAAKAEEKFLILYRNY